MVDPKGSENDRPLIDRIKELSADQLLELKRALRELEAPLTTQAEADEKEWEEYEAKVRAAHAAQLEVALLGGRIARKRMKLAVPVGWELATQAPAYTSFAVCGPMALGGIGGTAFGAACGGAGGTSFGAACGGAGGTSFGAACGGAGGTSFGVACGGAGGTSFGAACGGAGGTSFGTRCGGAGGTGFGAACGGAGA